ncbi:MAG: hydroxymethylbilane synthase [Nitrospiraceae bacterium]
MPLRRHGVRASLVIGTRGSRLAIWQAEWVQARLKDLAPDLRVTLRQIKTSGDKVLDVPLAAIGGKALFVKEIEEALLRREIDLAVHSLKDVPTVLPAGLELLCVPERDDPRDVLVSHRGLLLEQLPPGARVGTSSLRRQAQLLHYKPDLAVQVLRGNLDTRLRKLKAQEYDAIVLAAAGLRRMGWAHEVTEYLPFEVSLPAIGQGALGLEGRADDEFVRDVLSRLDHGPTRTAVTAERALLERLEGGCQVPIAAHAAVSGASVTLDGLIASVDGRRLVRDLVQGLAQDAHALGVRLGDKLLAQGGDLILKEIYEAG